MNTVEKGINAEKKSFILLQNYFETVEYLGGRNAFDLIVSNNDIITGINVKSGKNSFHINRNNLKRMLSKHPSVKPSYLLLDNEGSYLFSLEEIYPAIDKSDYKSYTILSSKKKYNNKSFICPQCKSSETIKMGYRITTKGKLQRYQCRACGHTFVPKDVNLEEAEG